jgi:hypothetical protein
MGEEKKSAQFSCNSVQELCKKVEQLYCSFKAQFIDCQQKVEQ